MTRITWKDRILGNWTYKIVALLISLILWLSVLGRKDYVMTKSIELEFIAPKGFQIAAQTADQVKLKVSGNRAALRRWMESESYQKLILEVIALEPGLAKIDIPIQKIHIPEGVKVLGVRPNQVQIELIKAQPRPGS